MYARLGVTVFLLVFLLPGIAKSASDKRIIVFDDVHVVHPKHGSVSKHQRLVVINERIHDVGDIALVPIPASAEVVQTAGWYVMPGLYEMHAHVPPLSAGEQQADDVLRLFLANGVTTVRGMLGEPWHLKLRNELAQGERIGPRLITSGPSFNGRSVESVKQAQQMVREQAAAGYDFLKLHPGLGPMEFDAIARTAKSVGISLAGHVSVDVGLQRALRVGQATIDHLDGYAQELLSTDSPLRTRDPGFFGIAIAADMQSERAPALARATHQADVWNVPTQSLMENILGDSSIESLMRRPEMVYIGAETKAQWQMSVNSLREEYRSDERQRFLQTRRALIAALNDADAGLLLGSDAPQIMNVPGFSIHEELAFMVKAGLSPRQALVMGSVSPAAFFQENQERAWLAPGYIADLVFLAKNPLDDINHTRLVQGVYHQAQWHDREQLDKWLAVIQNRVAK